MLLVVIIMLIINSVWFEGSNKILDIFLLRFGAVVLDYEVPFCLRLEVICIKLLAAIMTG